MVRYTIAMCNKNMAVTIEESIRSIAEQVDENYEILVVDDGSTDGSKKILHDLSEEFENLRVVEGNNSNLAEARNQSFEEARGEVILESLDTDDRYSEGIADFVEIYEQLNENVDFDFFLKGQSISIASRELLLEYPYRSMQRAEDLDLWKRLFADDVIIWIDHEPFWNEIEDFNHSIRDVVRLDWKRKVSILRSGTTLGSCLAYQIRNNSIFDSTLYYHLVTYLLAFPVAKRRGIYDCPVEFRRRGNLEARIERDSLSIDELEVKYDFTFDRGRLSDAGKKLFLS